MEVKIPEPKYKVETVTLEEIDKRDERINQISLQIAYASSRHRPRNVHLNGAAACDPTNHPSAGWPANSATRW